MKKLRNTVCLIVFLAVATVCVRRNARGEEGDEQ